MDYEAIMTRLLLVLPLIACATPRVDGNTLTLPDGGPLVADSESTRAVLKNNCGTCHLGTHPAHKPEAVAVFDLDEAGEWARNVKPHQWKVALGRLRATDREEKVVAEFAQTRGLKD